MARFFNSSLRNLFLLAVLLQGLNAAVFIPNIECSLDEDCSEYASIYGPLFKCYSFVDSRRCHVGPPPADSIDNQLYPLIRDRIVLSAYPYYYPGLSCAYCALDEMCINGECVQK
ncbi:hypothetical protein DdX_11117 [Ditylenchus destructor]|uniref:Uncharacterized protein n=1 Tax=Ditylenchus destructor TaxID=166010 RepID=A0AAD4R1H8_9BILA|nr:hypothetical protein DdX_11117 [Ditylenchus destructor]